MPQDIRIGVIGVGQIGERHLRRYSKIDAANVVAVCDLLARKVKGAKAEFDIPDGYDDFTEVLKRDDVDAVDVCVHNNKHAPITIAALEAGKHVYCEKPMAGTYRDAEDMLDASGKHGRKLSVQLGSLFSMETRVARRLIDDGRLGKVYYARSFGYRRRGRPFVDGYGTANFVDASISAGGALYDMGVYHIADILYLLDNPEALTVTGAAHQELDMYEDRREFSNYSVEETGLGWVRLDGGISFDIEETWAGHQGGDESSKILGSKGGIKLNPLTFFSGHSDVPGSTTFDLRNAKSRWHSCFPDTECCDSPQHHWIGALQGRVALLPTAEIALNTMLISEGIYMSSRLGREVTAEQVRTESLSTAIDPYTPEKVWRE